MTSGVHCEDCKFPKPYHTWYFWFYVLPSIVVFYKMENIKEKLPTMWVWHVVFKSSLALFGIYLNNTKNFPNFHD